MRSDGSPTRPGGSKTRRYTSQQGFRDGIASHLKGENKIYLLSMPSRRSRKVAEVGTCTPGTVIDELTAVVERAETRADEREREDRLAYWYAVAQQELAQADSSLAGVA